MTRFRKLAAGDSAAKVIEHLVHGTRGLSATRLADHPCRYAGDRHIVGHRFEHHRAGGYTGAVADFDIAEDLRSRSDHDAIVDFGMAVAVLATGAAERHIMQDRDV